jgi:hypothetical protein
VSEYRPPDVKPVNVKAVMTRVQDNVDAARHRELVKAVSATSWRRDITMAAIGAGFGVVGTLIATALT